MTESSSALPDFLEQALGFHRAEAWGPAMACYAQCFDARKGDPDFLRLFGTACYRAGEHPQAVSLFGASLVLNPDQPAVWINRGNALKYLYRQAEAIENYDQALLRSPASADVYSNRGVALRELGRFSEALESFSLALGINPNHAIAANNRGMVEEDLGLLAQAEASYRQAIRSDPSLGDAYSNLGMLKLAQGQFEEGWALYEWRLKLGHPVLAQALPEETRWQGEPRWGETLLLQAEQGFGDIVHFCRYIPRLQNLFEHIYLEAPDSLHTLLRTSFPGNALTILPLGAALPSFDVHCPIMSLPLAFKTTLKTIPAEIPYLRPLPDRVKAWSEVLGPKTMPRVGVVWSGAFHPGLPEMMGASRRRNMPLEKLAPLNMPGIQFLSLQKGDDGQAELDSLRSKGWGGPALLDHTAALSDFSETAALIENLDLVISVDTAVLHVAGALGKPVWMVDRLDHCWRWLGGRSDSPWYPTLRIFRQKNFGSWDEPVADMVLALQAEFELGTSK